MADYLIQDTTLDAIADAINTKLGTSVAMTPAEMVTEIESIQTGASIPLLISHEAITIVDDMLTTETNGNMKYFGDTFLPSVSSAQYPNGWPTVLVLIDNTFTSGNYYGIAGVRISAVNAGGPTRRLLYRADGNVNADFYQKASFFIGAGSTVHRYVFVRPEVLT